MSDSPPVSAARAKANDTIKKYTEQYETRKIPKHDEEKTKTDILNRLSQFTDTTSSPSIDWIGILLDCIIAVLSLLLIYKLYWILFPKLEFETPETSDISI